MKEKIKILIFSVILITFTFLNSQDTLEEIVTWEIPEGETLHCVNLNSDGSDINNDGYDDFILLTNYYEWKYYFYLGSQNPTSQYNFEIEVPFGSGYPSWGGDLNGDGYKDIVFGIATNEFDPGDVYICLGSEEIDLEPEMVLHGEDYVADPTALFLTGFNGGYDFNGDGYDDLLTWGEGPSLFWNGLIQIFLGCEELDATPDFQIQGNEGDEFGRYRAVGDINGDGYDDLIVSRYIGNPGVKFEVYFGGEVVDTIPDFVTSEVFELTNNSLMDYAKGDVNNDGFDDVLISALGIFLGTQNGSINLDYPITESLRYVNINGDEYDDVLSYAYEILSIFYGSDYFDLLSDITLYSANRSFCNIGDYNNDGEDEILVNHSGSSIPGNSATMYGLSSGGKISNYELRIINYELNNYPNPFNPITTISYKLPVNIANTVIEIFNIKGEKIRTFNCRNQIPIIWDGTDNHRKQVSSGIYLYRIKADNFIGNPQKMLMLK
ncbi:MAG TPA: FG-GAP-like repeat-containing protein [Candidatus Cloacimonadota bacterium]|nr:FG-GAP-like repeat-containing protein [Candidatus Cloacimonadota bacterium]